MRTRLGLLWLIILIQSSAIAVTKKKEQTFPFYIAFRGEHINGSKDYAHWKSYFENCSALSRKFIEEEITINPKTINWSKRLKQERKGFRCFLHLNGEGRQVMEYPNVHKRFFPGHWVYLPGSTLMKEITKEDSILFVEKSIPFKVKGYINRHTTPKSWFPHHLIIVPLDHNGKRIWQESEYLIVKHVNHHKNSITVERGAFYSKRRSFKHGAYIAPLAADVWGKFPMWYYNFSTLCPKNDQGKNAGEVYAEEIASWFHKKGKLAHFDGITFDVNYFDVSRKGANWDTNNDGKADGGMDHTINKWRAGDWEFFRYLRHLVGEDKIITCDGHHDYNQQAVGLLDGIESEGLVQHNDGWRGFSRTINTHLYWDKYTQTENPFRYIVMKYMDPKDFSSLEQQTRFGFAVATVLGAGVTQNLKSYKVPSTPFYLPKEIQEEGIFGEIIGKLERLVKKREPVVSINNKQAAELFNFKQGQENRIITFQDIPLTLSEYTLFIKMKSESPLMHKDEAKLVPRRVWLLIDGKRHFIEDKNGLHGFINSKESNEVSFYLRPELIPITNFKQLSIEVEGNEPLEIEKIELYNGPDIIQRKFTHYTITVNPSLKPQLIKIDNKKIIIEPLDFYYQKN